MRTLVTTDIHGCYKQFMELINKIKLTKYDEFIILGDLVDRGPENMAVVLEIAKMRAEGYNIITIKGNHEEMFLYGAKKYHTLDEFKTSTDHLIFTRNGTNLSLYEYYELSKEDKEIVINELIRQRYFYQKEDFLFVHAGVFPNEKLEEQDKDDLLWIRDIFINNAHNLPYVVVFGHTPTPYLNPEKECKIFRGEDKIGIDCGCVFGGKLACLDVFNNIEYYVDGFIKTK